MSTSFSYQKSFLSTLGVKSGKTLCAMVSIGSDRDVLKFSFPRFWAWCSKWGYDCILIKQPLTEALELPHFNKLHIPLSYAGYDKYLICDDDILISSLAPELPEVPDGYIGMVPDVVQSQTTNDAVKWTANSGFLVATSGSIPLFESASKMGRVKDVWSIADQGPINVVAWTANKVYKIDVKWNYAPVLDYAVNRIGWKSWRGSRAARIRYFVGIQSRVMRQEVMRIRSAWGLHLIHRGRMTKPFENLLP